MLAETKDIAAIRARLLARKQELDTRHARLHADQRRILDPLSPDAPDRAVQQQNDPVVDRIDSAVESELRAIDQALVRLETGRYGVCTSCGREISAKRLQAVPYADLCQSCMAQANS